MHAQRVKKCTQLGAISKPSYLSHIKSDVHKTFSVCQDWSPVLIYNVYGGAHAICMHAHNLGEVNKPSYLIQMKPAGPGRPQLAGWWMAGLLRYIKINLAQSILELSIKFRRKN